ncbi:unnamed protein product [Haemonchus placei]|uniref:Uncharacterized protein n=1 Tax=Haemonchus placei TaxID=6290 RepID=A0A3P7YJQ7_HAEPC|nr:unnamed protein product [Haemonchus placei]
MLVFAWEADSSGEMLDSRGLCKFGSEGEGGHAVEILGVNLLERSLPALCIFLLICRHFHGRIKRSQNLVDRNGRGRRLRRTFSLLG